jgi:outer membrane immunogenic protein
LSIEDFQMKRVLLAATALVASAGLALAADLPQRQITPAPYATPAFTWTGFYVGAHGGYAWGEARLAQPGFGTATDDIDGGFGGLQAGYNHQFGQFVLGLEVDGSFGDIGVKYAVPGGTASSSIDWMGTARVRGGVAFDRALIYATGGFAWANNEIKVSQPGVSISQDKMHTGWALGAGVEYAFTNNLSAKVEYLYMDFGKEIYFADLGGVDFDGHIHTIKAGLNYRF